jgi:Ser/Thr protein kinase RdoA (MazF antagonist)
MTEETPTILDVATIVRTALHAGVIRAERMLTGWCHHVYDVRTDDDRNVVVRVAPPESVAYLVGGVYWSRRLRPMGVPLPELLHADVDGVIGGFPFMILERLEGTDLAHVYATLSKQQKVAIAEGVANAQRRASTLPVGRGFGFTFQESVVPPHRSAADLLAAGLERSRSRLSKTGVADIRHVDRVAASARRFEDYLSAIRPLPFLDDTTTKNVIICSAGRLSGIVDVDEICYGDRMMMVGLTRMALLARRESTDYVDMLCDAMEATDGERQVLDLYTAECCIDFLSEHGQTFNRGQPMPVDWPQVEHLLGVLETLLA